MRELEQLLNNFDETQLDILAGIAVRMAGIKAEKWTGQITFVLNSNQGAFGDTHVNKGEIIRTQKKRKVRSRF